MDFPCISAPCSVTAFLNLHGVGKPSENPVQSSRASLFRTWHRYSSVTKEFQHHILRIYIQHYNHITYIHANPALHSLLLTSICSPLACQRPWALFPSSERHCSATLRAPAAASLQSIVAPLPPLQNEMAAPVERLSLVHFEPPGLLCRHSSHLPSSFLAASSMWWRYGPSSGFEQTALASTPVRTTAAVTARRERNFIFSLVVSAGQLGG